MLPTRIGPYVVEREAGRGGMGVVYRARDPRLDRPVAIKVLPDEFARDPERLARFEREARLLASLIHPNIAAIHGIEEDAGRRFLVLEYVDGLTLAERLASGPLSIAETVDVARQIAAALETAHEAGVIHRDLKPGNVKLTPGGEVKVLDFGLARGADPAGSDSGDARHSPTLSLAATGAGVILGTAAYMSPEQARGKPIDRRTDIWSFGAVLYECLTGKQAFPGETVSDSIARILQSEPDPAPLPAGLPSRLRALLARCLEKDPKRRLRDIGDARIELEELMGVAPPSSRLGYDARAMESSAAVAPTARPSRRARLGLLVAAAAAGALVAWFATSALRPGGAERAPLRFTVEAPSGTLLAGDPCQLAISPDGRTLAFVAADSAGTANLWLRPLDAFAATMLPGTEDCLLPFWSPDSRSLAFFSLGKLRRTTPGAGLPEAICDAPNPRGGSWGAKDVIVFAPSSSGPLHRVEAKGGTSRPVTIVDSTAKETGHRFPAFLPDGEHFLYTAVPIRDGRHDNWIGSIGGGKRPAQPLMRAFSAATFAGPSHLLFHQSGKLMAQRFDARSRRLAGEPFVVGDPPERTTFSGSPAGSASHNGVLAWTVRAPEARRFVIHEKDGRLTPVPRVQPGEWIAVVTSPDGRLALAQMEHASGMDLWMIDLTDGSATRLTSGSEVAETGPFMPDGESFLFGSNRLGVRNFYRRRVDGVGGDSLVYQSPVPYKNVRSVTPDGAEFIFQQVSGDSSWDIYACRFGSSQARPVVATKFAEEEPSLSPDGRWLLWLSNESGTPESYLAAYPGLGGKRRIPTGGPAVALWSRDGRSIRLATPGGGNLREIRFDPATGTLSSPRVLPPGPEGIFGGAALPGGRILLVQAPQTGQPEISIAVDWLAAQSAGRNRAR